MIKVSENTYIQEDLDLIQEKRFPMKFFNDNDGRAAFKLELAFVLDEVKFKKVKYSTIYPNSFLREEDWTFRFDFYC